ncbi:hypothetical protein Asppvi_000559 [Aspergillus pseudoviridinutans]|uniref:Uncharacterized protein n=1 Tax=Aspergillus pseudoviridinutans TaxID=1517512 RepID=A0A9P3B6F0_9EURO|nr:uncharacterized protein Asppvi_000559 [Aspergillus pseudoviridinutans]GIJ82056.1 hypothetical protein Asppvi_000559 [Aspergillus pseudoviridinutans]
MGDLLTKLKRILSLKALRQRLSDAGWVLAAKQDLDDTYGFPQGRYAGQGYDDYNFPPSRWAGQGYQRG